MLARWIATVAALLLAYAQAGASVRVERVAGLDVDRIAAAASPGDFACDPETARPARAYPADLASRQKAALTHCHVWQKSLGEPNRASARGVYRYTGEQLDPNLGFYYLRARYMDPAQGRFPGMDPWGGDSSGPITLHKYVYGNGNPIGNIDPSGLHSLVEQNAALNINVMGRQLSLATLRRQVKRAITETIKSVGQAKEKVRKCLRSARTCDLDVPVFAVGNDLATLADHILDAQLGAGTNLVPSGFMFSFRHKAGNRQWYDKTLECGEVRRRLAGVGKQCDEFPMYSMNRGGPANHPTFVSLRFIDSVHNVTGGAIWNVLARVSGMKVDPKIRALVIAWREIPLSKEGLNKFRFLWSDRVNDDGCCIA